MGQELGFWRKVENLRRLRVLSVNEMAARIGVTPGNWRYWTHHGAMPSMTMCAKMAKALGVTMEYLVSDDEDMLSREDFPDRKDPDPAVLARILEIPRLCRIAEKLPGATNKQLALMEILLHLAPGEEEARCCPSDRTRDDDA